MTQRFRYWLVILSVLVVLPALAACTNDPVEETGEALEEDPGE